MNGKDPIMKFWLLAVVCLAQSFSLMAQSSSMLSRPSPSEFTPKLDKGRFEAAFSLGAGIGEGAFGGLETHDFLWTTVDVGWVFANGKHGTINGTWELVGEFMTGLQLYPERAEMVGFAPLLRYNFKCHSRIMPFFSFGAGTAWTDIGEPDLGSHFQFISQAGPGVHFFLKENLGLTLQYRFAHISNGGMDWPNRGINTHVVMAGLSYVF